MTPEDRTALGDDFRLKAYEDWDSACDDAHIAADEITALAARVPKAKALIWAAVHGTDIWRGLFDLRGFYTIVPMLNGHYKAFGLSADECDGQAGVEFDTLADAQEACEADWQAGVAAMWDGWA